LPEGAKKGAHLKRRCRLKHRASMNSRQVHDVLEKHGDVRHVFPDEQILVLADRILYEIETELRL
jgi:hypothetical protein